MSLPKPYYQDSAVTIYCCDNQEIMTSLGKFDLLLTDPPYGIGMDKHMHKMSGVLAGHGNRRVAWKSYPSTNWDNCTPSVEVISLMRSICAKQIIWGGNYFELPPCNGPLIWDKENGTTNFADGEMAWNNLGTPLRIRRHLWNGMCKKGLEKRDHPTQKPLEIMSWCIGLAGEVQTILDPFGGVGTTARAAKDLGKKCVLIEREERYCEIAARRMAQEVFAF